VGRSILAGRFCPYVALRVKLRSSRVSAKANRSLVECLLKKMAKREPYRNRIEILQGTLDMIILSALQWGPQHGHGIGEALKARSDNALQIEHGSLYPALHRLEKEGWLASEWKQSEANRRAKYYRLTAAGKRQLTREQSNWDQIVRTVARIMSPLEEV